MTLAISVPNLVLNDEHSIPQLGLGVFKLDSSRTHRIVQQAIDCGYRSIDTALIYANEAEVGQAIRESSVGREELFVTTKLWNDDQGFETTLSAFEGSLNRLGLDYVDLYLIHWPAPARDRYVESWRALVQLQSEGRVRSIGVSNFEPEHLDRIIDATSVVPAVNQIELHPYFQQRELSNYHDEHGIITESWSPLGRGGALLRDPVISNIAVSLGKTPAQIVIRWHLQKGYVVIPKTATPPRLAENIDVFGFELNEAQVSAIDSLNNEAGRIGPNPSTAAF